jgi:hypothetical protein
MADQQLWNRCIDEGLCTHRVRTHQPARPRRQLQREE